jgi:PAS domain-containing protein
MPPEFVPPAAHRYCRGNETPTREYALNRLDGEQVYVRASAIPITYDDQPSALTVLIDVTQRRKAEEALRLSEERYRNLLEQAPVAITVSRQDDAGYLRDYMNADLRCTVSHNRLKLGTRLVDMLVASEYPKSME